MSNTQFSCCHLLFQPFLGQIRNLPNLDYFDFKACFGRMASSLKWKAAPFGSRPQPIAFKMTNNYLSKQRHVSNLSTNNINIFSRAWAGFTFSTARSPRRTVATITTLVSSCIFSFLTNFLHFTRLFTVYGWPPPCTTTTTAAHRRVFIFNYFKSTIFFLFFKKKIDDPRAWNGPKRAISFGP